MSEDRNFWVRPARVEEGSFCDRDSGIHYDNVSHEEADNQAANAAAQGDDVIDVRDEGNGENLRVNCTSMSIDGEGNEYPTRLSPGG